MFETETLMTLIPALPLLAAIVIGIFGKGVFKERSHLPCIAAIACSFLCAAMLLTRVIGEATPHGDEHATTSGVGFETTHTLWTWANIIDAYNPGRATEGPEIRPAMANFTIDVTLRADGLTCIMLCMVTFVATLVAIYASGYMHGDEGYWRFFAYVSLFVFSMTMLVSVSNFALLYVFWEAVGVCSYLLIGFWYEKPSAAAAGKKAFLVNRIGDFGFALAVFLIWTTYGTLNFHDTAAADGTNISGVLGQSRLADPALFVAGTTGLLIALGLMTGAAGKSAQFPLHVWLPDAMEGPTPVSALIHAATMVTAGVYLVARCTPLFHVDERAQMVVACIGAFTALLGGLIGLTQTDLKRVLAYSTVSQLGYMFLGLGCGTLAGIVAGFFHLFTHAFFKALLFLGAGSVMHAMGHVIDMRRFSGLRHIMPWTFRTFWFGSLALAGIVPFAGFWSKDAILAAVRARGHDSELYNWLLFVAMFAALLTAFYTFRALFMTFYGPTRVPPEAGHHAHESPPSMTAPLVILAFFALVIGMYVEFTHGFLAFLTSTPSLAYAPVFGHGLEHAFDWNVAGTSTVLGLVGIGLAAAMYLGQRTALERVNSMIRTGPGLRLYQLSYGKFFFDQIYGVTVIWPLRIVAFVSAWFDRWVIDGFVDFVGRVPPAIGSMLRALQAGLVQFYALAMVLGLLVLLGSMLIWRPLG